MKRLAFWLSENNNKRFWFLLAFIVYIFLVWFGLSSNSRSRYPENIDAQEQQAIEQSWP